MGVGLDVYVLIAYAAFIGIVSVRLLRWTESCLRDWIYRRKREINDLKFQLELLEQDVSRLEKEVKKLKTKNKRR